MASFPFNNRNRRSHPFWDFVASMEDLNNKQRPPSYAPRDRSGPEQAAQAQAQEKDTYKAPAVEDEKMADANAGNAERDATSKKATGRKHKGKARDQTSDSSSSSSSSSDEGQCCDRRRCRRRCSKGKHFGRPPFGPWGFPGFLGPDGGRDFQEWGPPHPRHMHHHGPPGRHHRGPPPQGPNPGEHPPPPPHPEFGPHRHHGRRHWRGGPFGPRGVGREFNVAAFLSQLGNRLGVDLNAAAANFGLDLSRLAAAGNPDVDFVPYHDLFDLSDEYLIHVSLPGAQREDIGLDFDGEHHTLRVGGVVYRPGIDENISSAISHSGRNREVGVFETKIRLPSQGHDLIEVNAASISAKLRDGVLVIHVPKVHKNKEDLKRSVHIDTPSPSPERETRASNLTVREKDPNQNNPFAADNKNKEKTLSPQNEGDMYYSSPPVPAAADSPGTEKGEYEKAVHEKERNEAGVDTDMKDQPEQLPAYAPSHRGDEEDEDQEGEYVKINVD